MKLKKSLILIAFAGMASTSVSAGSAWTEYKICLLENLQRAILENPGAEATKSDIRFLMYSVAPHCSWARRRAAHEVVEEQLGTDAIKSTDMAAVERDLETATISDLISDLVIE